MRLWHYYLIDVLPDKQLQGQWRECCLIAKGLCDGTLNHLLVNKVKNYPEEDFIAYTAYVWRTMKLRGHNPNWDNFSRYFGKYISPCTNKIRIFENWHGIRYLVQCYFNLQEKYDCGGISDEEWNNISVVCRDIQEI